MYLYPHTTYLTRINKNLRYSLGLRTKMVTVSENLTQNMLIKSADANETANNKKRVRRLVILICCITGTFGSIFVMVLYHTTRSANAKIASNEAFLTNSTEEGNFM